MLFIILVLAMVDRAIMFAHFCIPVQHFIYKVTLLNFVAHMTLLLNNDIFTTASHFVVLKVTLI